MPSTSVCTSEASPRQYSADVLVRTSFGSLPFASRRRPSARPRAATRSHTRPGAAGPRTAGRHGGEREQAADGAGGVQRRLTEAVVELAPAGAGDVGHHAVEDRAPRLVLVQAEVEEMAEEPPRLRHAQNVGALELA